MLKRYLATCALAFFRHSLGGIGNGLGVVGNLVEVAFHQSVEDLNAERYRQVHGDEEPEPEEPKIKLKPEDMN